MRSIESPFRFESYKIDAFSVEVVDDLEFLKSMRNLPSDNWEFRIGLRQPRFFGKSKLYVGGLELDLRLTEDDESSSEGKDQALVSIHAGISGVFRCKEGELPPDIEGKLVKNHIPALLFPYLRSAITSFLANGGYGSLVLPLVNINTLAEKTFKDVEVLHVNEDMQEETA